MFGAALKRAFAFNSLLNISFRDGTTFSAPEDRVMNITGVTNHSLGTTIRFNASEISNFTISNVTTYFASTVTLPISLLPLFESATAASELQGALSTVTISVSTTSFPDGHRSRQSSSVISSTNHAVAVHPVPTESAVKSSIGDDGPSNGTASHSSPASLDLPMASAQPASQGPMKTSARSIGSSNGTVSLSSTPILGLSKTSAESMKNSTQPTVSSAISMTTLSKLAVTRTNHTAVLNHETASGQGSSTTSNYAFEIMTSSGVKGIPTASTEYCWDPASKSHYRPRSLATSTPKHLPVCKPSLATSILAGHLKVGDSLEPPNNGSTPAANFSRISTLDASVDKINNTLVGLGSGRKALTAGLHSNDIAENTFGFPSANSSAPIWVPAVNSNPSGGIPGGGNSSSNNFTHAPSKSLQSMLEDVLEPTHCRHGISKAGSCELLGNTTSNATSIGISNSTSVRFSNSTLTRFSNSSESGSYATDDTDETDDEMSMEIIRNYCETHASVGINPVCKHLQADPGITFGNLTKLDDPFVFDYIEYFNALNDLENFPDEPDIPDVEYFALNLENLRDSQTFEWYSGWTVLRQGSEGWLKHGEWQTLWREFLHEPNFKCPDGMASCNYSPPTLEDILRRISNNRPLARRVLFVTLMLDMMHSYSNLLDERFAYAEEVLKNIVPEIVQAFTLQLNGDKKSKCDIIEAIVSTTINLVIDVSIGVLTDGIGLAIVTQINAAIESRVRRMVAEIQARKFTKLLNGIGPSRVRKIDFTKSSDEIRHDIHHLISQELHAVEQGGNHAILDRLERLERLIPDEVTPGLQDAVDHIENYRSLDIWVQQEFKGKLAKSQLKSWSERKEALENLRRQKWKVPNKKFRDNMGEPRKAVDHFMPYLNNVLYQLIWNPFSHIPQSYMGSHYHFGGDWFPVPDDGPAEESDFDASLVGRTYRSWPADKLDEHREQAQAPLRGGHTDLPTIIGGKGSGWMCADFEGDWKDLNAPNKDLLAKRIAMELDNGRRQVWTLFKEMYEGATPEIGKPSMVARWMLARRWVGKDERGTVEYDLNHKEIFYKTFELDYVKEIASATLAQGHNYMKCSRRTDAVEKCSKIGDWYESFICPRPETDPNLICMAARWYFSDWSPHEIEMDALRSVEQFGALRGFTFNKQEMLQEIFENYQKHGNNWGQKDWGIQSFDGGKHPRGWHLPVCMYAFNEYDVFEHQRPWWHNENFPATCGDHHANETAGFMKAMNLAPGSGKHTAADRTFTSSIPLVLQARSPYTRYVSMCNTGIRFPSSSDYHYHFWWWEPRRGVQTDKDHIAAIYNCGTIGHPACPEEEQPYGDQDCLMVKEATQYMTEDEANVHFCANACGHTVFTRDIKSGKAEARINKIGKVRLVNFADSCGTWLDKHGRQALEDVSHRTLDNAEKGIVAKMLSGPMESDYETLGNATSAELFNGNSTMERELSPVDLSKTPKREEAIAAWDGKL